MSNPEVKKCQACGASVTVLKTGGFKLAHKCPKHGETVPEQCPQCKGACKWTVGAFSTFRACANGKYWGGACEGKYHAPRGSNALKPKAEKVETAPEKADPFLYKGVWAAGGCILCGSADRNGNFMWCSLCASRRLQADKDHAHAYCAAYDEAKTETETPPSTPAETETMTAPNSPQSTDAAANALWALVGPAARAEIEKLARDAAAKAAAEVAGKTVTIEIKINADTFKVEPTAHKLASKIVSRLAMFKAAGKGQNAYLVGPAGSGKTTLARDVAKAFSLPFGAISCSAGMSESKIEGRNIPKLTTGEDLYQSTQFVEIYRNGGVFLFDEIDGADANVLLVINAALANGHMNTPGGEIKRHENCYILCAANTFGTGADRIYVGRAQLDGAFLDRFKGRMFEVDYDKEIEGRILGNASALAKVWAIREKAATLKLRRIVGTRFVEAVAIMLAGGMSANEAIGECVVEWTAEEKSKVGIAA